MINKVKVNKNKNHLSHNIAKNFLKLRIMKINMLLKKLMVIKKKINKMTDLNLRKDDLNLEVANSNLK